MRHKVKQRITLYQDISFYHCNTFLISFKLYKRILVDNLNVGISLNSSYIPISSLLQSLDGEIYHYFDKEICVGRNYQFEFEILYKHVYDFISPFIKDNWLLISNSIKINNCVATRSDGGDEYDQAEEIMLSCINQLLDKFITPKKINGRI